MKDPIYLLKQYRGWFGSLTGVKMFCSSRLLILYMPYFRIGAFVQLYFMNKALKLVHQKHTGSVLVYGATEN